MTINGRISISISANRRKPRIRIFFTSCILSPLLRHYLSCPIVYHDETPFKKQRTTKCSVIDFFQHMIMRKRFTEKSRFDKTRFRALRMRLWRTSNFQTAASRSGSVRLPLPTAPGPGVSFRRPPLRRHGRLWPWLCSGRREICGVLRWGQQPKSPLDA